MPGDPIVLRDEPIPDDAVVIIRGGELAPATARKAVLNNRAKHGYFGLSVEAALDADWETVCRTSPRLRGRYGQVRLSEAGHLRRAGFPLFPTGDRPHYDVVLPDDSDYHMDRLIACFGDPVDNPGRDMPPFPRPVT